MSGSVSMIDGHIDEVLKPCPFCGGGAEMGFKRGCYNHWKPEGFFPRCKDTKCLGRTYRKYITERAPIDEEMSTPQWIVYRVKEPCTCGGAFKARFMVEGRENG